MVRKRHKKYEPWKSGKQSNAKPAHKELQAYGWMEIARTHAGWDQRKFSENFPKSLVFFMKKTSLFGGHVGSDNDV